jgi:hypothetical protein
VSTRRGLRASLYVYFTLPVALALRRRVRNDGAALRDGEGAGAAGRWSEHCGLAEA